LLKWKIEKYLFILNGYLVVRNCYLLEEGLKYLMKVAEGEDVLPQKIVVR
jgi:hypothetical protein